MRALRISFLVAGTVALLAGLVVQIEAKALVLVLVGIGLMVGAVACVLAEGLAKPPTKDKGVDWYA